MADTSPENSQWSKIRLGFLLGVGGLLVLALLCGAFFALGKYCATYALGQSGGQAGLAPEVFLAEITDFYECIISILFGVIGVVLAVAFVYVHSISRQQARDMAIEALESTSFENAVDVRFLRIQGDVEREVKKSWSEFKTENELSEIQSQQADLTDRLQFVEQVLDTYPEDFPDDLNLSESPDKE